MNARPAPSTYTRRSQNVHHRPFHFRVHRPASSTSQSVVRIHHFDNGRVIIANQIITQSHSIHSPTCNELFFHPRPLTLTLCGERPRRVGYYKLGVLKSSNGEANSSSSTGITEAHMSSSEYRPSPPLGDHLALACVPSLRPSR